MLRARSKGAHSPAAPAPGPAAQRRREGSGPRAASGSIPGPCQAPPARAPWPRHAPTFGRENPGLRRSRRSRGPPGPHPARPGAGSRAGVPRPHLRAGDRRPAAAPPRLLTDAREQAFGAGHRSYPGQTARCRPPGPPRRRPPPGPRRTCRRALPSPSCREPGCGTTCREPSRPAFVRALSRPALCAPFRAPRYERPLPAPPLRLPADHDKTAHSHLLGSSFDRSSLICYVKISSEANLWHSVPCQVTRGVIR